MKKIDSFWQRYNGWIKVIGTLTLFSFLIVRIPIYEVLQQFKTLSPFTALLSLCILWAGMTLFAMVWRMLLQGLAFSVTIRQVWSLFFQALFIGNFASFLAGDVMRSYRLGHSTDRMIEVTLSVVVSRLMMFYTVTLLAGISLWLWTADIGWPLVIQTTGEIIVIADIIVVLVILILCSRLKSKEITPNDTHLQLGIKTLIRLGSQPKLMLFVIGQSLLGQLLTVWSVWWIAQGLDVTITWWQLLTFLSIMGIVLVIPISFNGLGLREVGLVSLMEQIGIDPAKALALSLMTSIIIIVASLPGGALMLWDSWSES